MGIGSRTRWITSKTDNHGFANWVVKNLESLMALGPGHHFGEWWGSGIQRAYGLIKGDKRFSLFNTSRWNEETPPPACCSVVPVLAKGIFPDGVASAMLTLIHEGSKAAPGFMNPEGIVIYHVAGGLYFKKTIEKDEVPKGLRGV